MIFGAPPCEVHDVLDKIYSLRNSPPDCFSQICFSFVDEFGASCLKKARKNAPDNRSVSDKQIISLRTWCTASSQTSYRSKQLLFNLIAKVVYHSFRCSSFFQKADAFRKPQFRKKHVVQRKNSASKTETLLKR